MTCLLPYTTCAFVQHMKRCNTSSFDNVINVSEIMSQIFVVGSLEYVLMGLPFKIS
jgi:hypothetical protein